MFVIIDFQFCKIGLNLSAIPSACIDAESCFVGYASCTSPLRLSICTLPERAHRQLNRSIVVLQADVS